jgi:hypothetical protein
MSQNQGDGQEAKKFLKRAEKKFKQLDVNGNGSLAGAELSKLVDWVFDSFNPGGFAINQE